MAKVKRVKRVIHYYEMHTKDVSKEKPQDKGLLITAFKKAASMNKIYDTERLMISYESLVYLRELRFDSENHRIFGKVVKVRHDMFPELIDTGKDIVRDINAAQDEGILEVTHFMINYKKSIPIIAIEYNQFGAKAHDLSKYMRFIMQKHGVNIYTENVGVIRDMLGTYKSRIARCSLFKARVRKENIAAVKKVDGELFDAFEAGEKFANSDYVEVNFKYDYRQKEGEGKIGEKIDKFINLFRNRQEVKEIFDAMNVEAEDADQNFRIEEFDFLNNKVKSKVAVEQKPKSRALISTDMFEHLKREFQDKIINPKYKI